MQVIQTFEGLASGTPLTAANSATTGDAYSADPTVPAGGTFAVDNTHAAHGTNGLKVATGATSGNCLAVHTFTGAATVYARFYVFMPTTTGWGNTSFGGRLRASTNQACRITFSATGVVQLRNGANSVVASGAVALSLDTWYRVEYQCTQGATGSAAVTVYALDGLVAVDSITPTTGSYAAANITEEGIGLFLAAANFGPVWLDDTVGNDTGLPGPASVAKTLTDTGAVADSSSGPSAAVATTDSVAVADVVAIAAAAAVTDTAAIADASALAAAVATTDTAATSDASDVAAAAAATDTAAIADTLALQANMAALTDLLTFTEAIVISRPAASGHAVTAVSGPAARTGVAGARAAGTVAGATTTSTVRS